MSAFPVTSVTLIAKIKNLAPGEDSAAWVRFWDTYQGAIRAFAALKGGVNRAYALEGEDIAAVAKKFGLSRNSVSQIKTRIEKRIVAAGREMIAKEGI